MFFWLRGNFTLILCISVITLLVAAFGQSSVEIQKITTEFLETPTGISISQPRFGWTLSSEQNGAKQSAYQIIISNENEEVWNSEKVKSDQSQLIKYEGTKLKSATLYRFTIDVWDQNNQLSSST